MHRARLVKCFVFIVGTVAATIIASATPAFAHAVLLQTSPTAGQVLLESPREVSLRFDEPVEASLGAVRLYDSRGRRIDTGATTKPSAQVVAVPVRTKLPGGAYVVTWRVISADSHPVQGSFTFQVGTGANATAPAVQALAGNLLSKTGGSKAVGVVYGVARWLVFTALALLIGTVAFVVLIWTSGVRSRRVRLLIWTGWTALVVATLASLLLEGPYGAGLGLSAAWKPSVIGDVLDTHFGHVLVVRLLLLIVVFPLLRALLRAPDDPTPRARSPRWRAMAGILAVGVVLTVSLAGHADVDSFVPLALVTDWLHLSAMSLWVGGLVVLAVAALAQCDLDELDNIVPRFSRVALTCVCALIVTGAYQTWRQVGGLEAFKRTDFGQLLTIKLAIFAVLLIVATRSRAITQYLFRPPIRDSELIPVVSGGADDYALERPTRRDDPDDDPDEMFDDDYERRTLRRMVGFEVVLAVAILVVSALLVNAQPGRTALKTLAFSGGSTGVTLKSDQIWVDLTFAPGSVGANDIHINTLLPSGALVTPLDLKLTLDQPSKGIAPLDVAVIAAGPGHYLATGVTIPLTGRWRVTARALRTPTVEDTVVGTVDIR
jgi:copper transport protein